MARKYKMIKAPSEFDEFLGSLTRDYSHLTGYAPNKSATMKRMAKLKGRLVINKYGDFDWRLM